MKITYLNVCKTDTCLKKPFRITFETIDAARSPLLPIRIDAPSKDGESRTWHPASWAAPKPRTWESHAMSATCWLLGIRRKLNHNSRN